MALRLILGFDYGTKQIGVAVGQVITGQARELCTLKAQNGVPDWNQVEALIKEWKPDAVVVGLPLNMDGSEGPMAREARAFGTWLEAGTGLAVAYEDERLSTDEAESFLSDAGLRPSDRRRLRDSVAAAVILRGVLEREGR